MIAEYPTPLKIGQIWPITFIPPTPRYWPIETSNKKRGMPQVNMAIK